MSSQAMVAVRAAAGLSAAAWPDERIDTVKRMYAPQAKSIQELAAFLATAERYDLDPVLGEIWLAPMQGGLKVLTGRDAMLKAASRDAGYRGIVSGVVYARDEFKLVRDGDKVTVNHVVNGMMNRGELTGAYCVAYHAERTPVVIIRRWDQYRHLQNKGTWKDYGEDMIETRAITAALRRQFRLAGLYHESEFSDAGAVGAAEGPVAELNRALAVDEEVEYADYEMVEEQPASAPVAAEPAAAMVEAETAAEDVPEVRVLMTLISDTKGSGKAPFATDQHRARLKELAEVLGARNLGGYGVLLRGLVGDAKLSAQQAGRILLGAVEAGLVARGAADAEGAA